MVSSRNTAGTELPRLPGAFVEVQQAVPLPAIGEQPDSRLRGRRVEREQLALPRLVAADRLGPAAEPRGARRRVDPVLAEPLLRSVVLAVEQHVAERVAYLARRLEIPRVIAVGEQLARAHQRRIQAARDTDLEALQSAREGVLVRGLGDQVQVVAEDVELGRYESRPCASAGCSAAMILMQAAARERAHAICDAQRDVQRKPRRLARPRRVRDRPGLRRPAGTRAPPAVLASLGLACGVERELNVALARAPATRGWRAGTRGGRSTFFPKRRPHHPEHDLGTVSHRSDSDGQQAWLVRRDKMMK